MNFLNIETHEIKSTSAGDVSPCSVNHLVNMKPSDKPGKRTPSETSGAQQLIKTETKQSQGPSAGSTLGMKLAQIPGCAHHPEVFPPTPLSQSHWSDNSDYKQGHHAGGKNKGGWLNNQKANKLHWQRRANENVAIVKSLQNQVNKLNGEKDAALQIARDVKEEKKDDITILQEKEQSELVSSQVHDIPSIRIVRSPLEDKLPRFLVIFCWFLALAPLYGIEPNIPSLIVATIWAIIIGHFVGGGIASMARTWLTPPPYTELINVKAPMIMNLEDIMKLAYKRPLRKSFIASTAELSFGYGAYTEIRVVGHYTTTRTTDCRMVADRPTRVNFTPQTLTALEIENPFYIKTVVAHNELVVQLSVKNLHKDMVDFMSKVKADNKNANQFNLTPIERSIVSSYTPQVASLMNEVMRINSNHLVSGNGPHLDF